MALNFVGNETWQNLGAVFPEKGRPAPEKKPPPKKKTPSTEEIVLLAFFAVLALGVYVVYKKRS